MTMAKPTKRVFSAAAALALLGIGLLPAVALGQTSAFDLYAAGEALARRGDVAGALKKFRQAQIETPNAVTLFAIAECHVALGNTAAAIAQYRMASVHPSVTLVMRQRAQAAIARLEPPASPVPVRVPETRAKVVVLPGPQGPAKRRKPAEDPDEWRSWVGGTMVLVSLGMLAGGGVVAAHWANAPSDVDISRRRVDSKHSHYDAEQALINGTRDDNLKLWITAAAVGGSMLIGGIIILGGTSKDSDDSSASGGSKNSFVVAPVPKGAVVGWSTTLW